MIEQNPGEDLDAFRKRALTKARITSVILGLAAVVAVLFMVYGFAKDIEAGKLRDIAIANERMAMETKIEAERQRLIADSANKEVNALKEQLMKCESQTKRNK